MGTPQSRVGVYIDFDNIVISRYNLVHGKGTFQKHKVRETAHLPETVLRSVEATVDIEAILHFAASLGTVALARAYADWSAPFNTRYRDPLVSRAVDLTQLFSTTTLHKNTADIRMAVDVVEDLFRIEDLTHVVIVSGDSDFVPLAQRVRRLGRRAVGIGMAGATSAALAGACDVYVDYDALPGTTPPAPAPDATRSLVHAAAASQVVPQAPLVQSAKASAKPKPAQAKKKPAQTKATKPVGNAPKKGPSALLVRALRRAHAASDAPWVLPTAVKDHMVALDPSFAVKPLGYASFSSFITSRSSIVEVDSTDPQRRLRLRPAFVTA
ncbi:NYN domain-containing protein [Sanguibacter suarezii]|uniref:NYN domain-containing protein n=1 Tax=Sanguibacter suarezii TaxID=60921 RepID=UPI000836ED54|nr:NYN domain-containing protein [Sanguibacter suarezii]